MKDIGLKILFELMKNAKVSDRSLAKEIGVSQPTVTRQRAKLEQDVIEGYTTIPKWGKLGYEILAFTFVKSKQMLGLEETFEAARENGAKWLMEQPNILMGGGCRGLGMDGFFISLHKSYHEFNEFMFQHKRAFGHQIDNAQTILVSIKGREILKPFHLKYLAEK